MSVCVSSVLAVDIGHQKRERERWKHLLLKFVKEMGDKEEEEEEGWQKPRDRKLAENPAVVFRPFDFFAAAYC